MPQTTLRTLTYDWAASPAGAPTRLSRKHNSVSKIGDLGASLVHREQIPEFSRPKKRVPSLSLRPVPILKKGEAIRQSKPLVEIRLRCRFIPGAADERAKNNLLPEVKRMG
jgi:hypothetical protein